MMRSSCGYVHLLVFCLPLIEFVHYANAASVVPGRLKILNFVVGYSDSCRLYSKRVSETMLSLGHNVTVFLMQVSENAGAFQHVKMPNGVKVHDFYGGELLDLRTAAFEDSGFLSITALNDWIRYHQHVSCDNFLSNSAVHEHVADGQFDVALNPYYVLCPVQVWRQFKIPTFMYAIGMYIYPHVADSVGLAYPASYVPDTTAVSSDRMSFLERVENFALLLHWWLWANLPISPFYSLDKELRKTPWGKEDPSLFTTLSNARGVVLNGEKFFEFPRPLSHDFIFMAGAVSQEPVKILAKEFQDIIESADLGVVVFALGSIVQSALMPLEMKMAFINSFARFPRHTIIWRSDTEFPEAREYKNIKFFKWLPQKDLLAQDKVKLFISHGGINSIHDAIYGAKPIIVIPMFYDQYSNAKRAERLGFGIGLNKMNLTIHNIHSVMSRILNNSSYSDRARKFQKMVTHRVRPVDEELNHFLLSRLNPNHQRILDSKAKTLNLLQYYSLDIVVAAISLLGLIPWTLLKTGNKYIYSH